MLAGGLGRATGRPMAALKRSEQPFGASFWMGEEAITGPYHGLDVFERKDA